MTSDMENREWLDEYKTLKEVSSNNPFTVPVGYFDGLNERIISAIKLDELKNTISPDCFTVPENYFGQLSGNIQSRIAVEELLNTENGFTIPENYFDDLRSNIQSRITVEEVLNTEQGFTVPENYFERLNSNIQSRLMVEEALNKAEDTFTVPQDYFAGLNKSILNKTVNQDIVKRKGAVIRMMSSTGFKYLTAACVVLMIGTGVFFQLESPTAIHNRSYLHKELSDVPVNDIQNYLEQNVDGNDAQHTVVAEDIPVNDADLKAALQNYTDSK